MAQIPLKITFTPADANLTGFASNVTGAIWTLTTTATSDGLAHRISIKNDAVTDHSAKTMILTGTDEDGKAQTETLNMPTGSGGATPIRESTKYFKTLTSIVPSATIGSDTMDIGWVDEFVSQTIPYNTHGGSGTLDFVVSGTIDYTSEYTLSAVQKEAKPFDWKDSNDTDIVNATTNQTSALAFPAEAVRVKINSYSSGATLIFRMIQFNQSA